MDDQHPNISTYVRLGAVDRERLSSLGVLLSETCPVPLTQSDVIRAAIKMAYEANHRKKRERKR